MACCVISRPEYLVISILTCLCARSREQVYATALHLPPPHRKNSVFPRVREFPGFAPHQNSPSAEHNPELTRVPRTDTHPVGPINSGEWLSKKDYESLLALNGWSKRQLSVLSVMFDIIHPDQLIIKITDGPEWGPRHWVAEKGRLIQDYSDICPNNITVQFMTPTGNIAESGFILNRYLHTPEAQMKTILGAGVERIDIKIREECYYQSLEGKPLGTCAIHRNGQIRAVLQTTEGTFVMEPLKHTTKTHHVKTEARNKWDHYRVTLPHLIYSPRRPVTTDKESYCGTTTDSRFWHRGPSVYNNRRKHSTRTLRWRTSTKRARRDIRDEVKWIELGLLVDTSMVDAIRNNHWEPSEMGLILTNLIDRMYQALNTRVILKYLEAWSSNDQIVIASDVSTTLLNLMAYSTEKLYGMKLDSLQLITAKDMDFSAEEIGVASVRSICTLKSVGVVNVEAGSDSLDVISIATHIAHMIAHNLGFRHDQEGECACPLRSGCIMRRSFRYDTGGYAPLFSSCSQDDYLDSLHMGEGTCLHSSPYQTWNVTETCGNGVVDQYEDCDCGGYTACLGKGYKCCDPVTCRLKSGAQCATGACCTPQCTYKHEGSLCRAATGDCDLPEYCNGHQGECPADGFKVNGQDCADGRSYCFNRSCNHLEEQCISLWGAGSKMASIDCYKRLNAEGIFNGHCGTNSEGNLKPCEPQDLLCGSIQCQGGNHTLNFPDSYDVATAAVIDASGSYLECRTRTISPSLINSDSFADLLPRDGTKCDVDMICLGGTCQNISKFIPRIVCPSDNPAHSCSEHGHCDDLGKCSCEPTFGGLDCGRSTLYIHSGAILPDEIDSTPPVRPSMRVPGGEESVLDSILVPLIMAILIAIFVIFFLMAVFCYKKPPRAADEVSSVYGSEEKHSGSWISSSPVSEKAEGNSVNRFATSGVTSGDLSPQVSGFRENGDTLYGSFGGLHRSNVTGSANDRLRKDAANSPFIRKSRLSLQRKPHSSSTCLYVNDRPEDRLSDEWTSISDETYVSQTKSIDRRRQHNLSPLLSSDGQLQQQSPVCRHEGSHHSTCNLVRGDHRSFGSFLPIVDSRRIHRGSSSPSLALSPSHRTSESHSLRRRSRSPYNPQDQPLKKNASVQADIDWNTDDPHEERHQIPPPMHELCLSRIFRRTDHDRDSLWLPLHTFRYAHPPRNPKAQDEKLSLTGRSRHNSQERQLPTAKSPLRHNIPQPSLTYYLPAGSSGRGHQWIHQNNNVDQRETAELV